MSPFIVAFWDGTNVWLQWDPDLEAKGYEVRLRFRAGGETVWEDWMPTIKTRHAWTIYPSNRKIGTQAQGEVRVAPPGRDQTEMEWKRATPAKFVRSRCVFEFSSQRTDLYYEKGVMFHCHVDGAACSYKLPDEIEIKRGEKKQIEMEAVASSGFAQLDGPDDFVIRPGLGITIRNVAASHSDLEWLTGSDYSVVEVAPRDGPVTIAFLRPEVVR